MVWLWAWISAIAGTIPKPYQFLTYPVWDWIADNQLDAWVILIAAMWIAFVIVPLLIHNDREINGR